MSDADRLREAGRVLRHQEPRTVYAMAVDDLLWEVAEHVASHDCEARCEHPDGCRIRRKALVVADAVLGADR